MNNNKIISAKKIAFVVFTIAAINIAAAQSTDRIVYGTEVYRPVINSPEIKMPEEVTITGFVKDENGNPLSNAKIKTASGVNSSTDEKGGFSFKMLHEEVAPQSIFFSYDSLLTAVRSYHPVMTDAVYDVTLNKPKNCCITIIKSPCIKPVAVYFKEEKSDLLKETKAELDNIAEELKDKPTVTLQIVANTSNRKSLQKLADKRLAAILNYLIEQKGISADRLTTDKSTEKGDTNSVDIKCKEF